ncbi:CaiB/BaiF CoA transferase family protein [Cognatishimia maritima]|uniref:Crotonobetainyl-CoA:carnitine CoA-transferase CaiB n=1 Tax=Cognatishimia maritima TaxID=870908 RepID=A0A1M5QKE5_9RHOB|nr:CoA transferase [Cognatishimia maritima]SHH14063.1 Crotonobetainyl-CoA:carnitine CoA-transferase CaiB [Cognatishimia maritima]
MSDGLQTLPLSGLRVLDFAQFLAGPVAAMRLSDLGAEVIKIERPQGGDLCRSMVVNDQMLEGDSLVFHTFNRGKKSVAADLKDAGDLEAVKRLIKTADVLIHNFRPGVMERIGLGYETVKGLNPRLVYAGVSGYGTEGPWVKKPGQDLLVQSLSGIAWLNGNAADGPVPTGFAMLDVATAGNLVQGILACLLRRGTTGQGGLVEVDLMTTAVDLTFEQFTCFLNDNNRQPVRHEVGNANPYQPAPYGIYKTANGYMAFAMTPLKVVADLLDTPAIAEFGQDKAFSHLNEIKKIVADVFATQPTQHWLDILEPAGIWCAPVLNWVDFVKTEGFKAAKLVQTLTSEGGAKALTTKCPIRIDGSAPMASAVGPKLGQDTEAVFAEVAASAEA